MRDPVASGPRTAIAAGARPGRASIAAPAPDDDEGFAGVLERSIDTAAHARTPRDAGDTARREVVEDSDELGGIEAAAQAASIDCARESTIVPTIVPTSVSTIVPTREPTSEPTRDGGGTTAVLAETTATAHGQRPAPAPHADSPATDRAGPGGVPMAAAPVAVTATVPSATPEGPLAGPLEPRAQPHHDAAAAQVTAAPRRDGGTTDAAATGSPSPRITAEATARSEPATPEAITPTAPTPSTEPTTPTAPAGPVDPPQATATAEARPTTPAVVEPEAAAPVVLSRAEDLATAIERMRPIPRGGASLELEAPGLGAIRLHVVVEGETVRIRIHADSGALTWFAREHDGLCSAARQAAPEAQAVDLQLHCGSDGTPGRSPSSGRGPTPDESPARPSSTHAPRSADAAPIRSSRRSLVDVIA